MFGHDEKENMVISTLIKYTHFKKGLDLTNDENYHIDFLKPMVYGCSYNLSSFI